MITGPKCLGFVFLFGHMAILFMGAGKFVGNEWHRAIPTKVEQIAVLLLTLLAISLQRICRTYSDGRHGFKFCSESIFSAYFSVRSVVISMSYSILPVIAPPMPTTWVFLSYMVRYFTRKYTSCYVNIYRVPESPMDRSCASFPDVIGNSMSHRSSG